MAPLKKEKVDLNVSERLMRIWSKQEEPTIPPVVRDDPFYQGRYDNRVETSILASFFRTPFGDIMDGMLSFQGYYLCGELETHMMNCLEAYGLPQGYKKCRDYAEDFFECSTQNKRRLRCKAMRDERRRQYYMGEREIKYAPPPKLGSYTVH